MALEDHIGDIVGKACAGLGIDTDRAARAAGMTAEEMGSFLDSGRRAAGLDFSELGRVLNLPPARLAGIAGGWEPPETEWDTWRHLRRISSRGMGMEVHAYAAWDPESREGALFDTGFDAGAVLDLIRNERIQLHHLFITHTHRDHIAALKEIRDAFGDLRLHSGTASAPKEQRVRPGDIVRVGSLTITARPTPGHAEDGITYVIGGWPDGAPEVAVVGDAIFSGSMGGARNAFQLARDRVNAEILSLPEPTLICPGHGPATTVGLEREHNPFF